MKKFNSTQEQGEARETVSDCIFCGGSRRHRYFLNGYDILQCRECHAMGVHDIPSDDFLFNFYQGFSFQTDIRHLESIVTPDIRAWMTGLLNTRRGTMLDFGGGGGFFAKAFEIFDLGEATYLDVDGAACQFASTQLQLARVLRGPLHEHFRKQPKLRFDFIYCRHVIEHLPDPGTLILELAELLSEKGVLVVSCPNGPSKEGLLYPAYWRKFLAAVSRENRWSTPYSILFSLSKKYGWGISPPRHLWAMSDAAIRAVVRKEPKLYCKVTSASLANAVHSPYHHSKGNLGALRDRVCDRLFGSVFSGMHLVAEIRRL